MTLDGQHSAEPRQTAPGAVTVMEGTTFCISDTAGDVAPPRQLGLFVRDTRILSTWSLEANGEQPEPLRVHHGSPHSVLLVSRVVRQSTPHDTDLLVLRERFVGDGMLETIRVRNATSRPTRVRLTLHVGNDFANLQVREGRGPQPHRVEASAMGGELRLSEPEPRDNAVTVSTDREATVEETGISWWAELGPHATWTTHVQVVVRLGGVDLQPHHVAGALPQQAAPAQRRGHFRRSTPRLSTAWQPLADVLARSVADLATLRIFDPERPRLPVVAAGAPWSMALFGRDSLLTSMMLLPVDAHLALGTLTTLCSHQGTRSDPVTGEQPGRILRELRFGPPDSHTREGGSARYGSADATPLFVMATGALHRWHPQLVSRELVACADRALEWMQGPADPDGDGFLEPTGSAAHGLAHQGWKDSAGGITRSDGSVPEPPVALAEVQAYAYAAYLARAELADAAREAAVAARWRREAERLKRAFNDSFWMPGPGWYAAGLDRDKRPIDAVTSNIGHCLWAGIVDDDKAEQVVERLMSPAMFTGWGIRTLSSDMTAYNPLGYHTGSVWPHDTALCVAGLARYGFADEARTLATGLLDVAAAEGHRLPELFAGISRAEVPVPVPYPAACSRQAWAAAAPVEVLRGLLRLEPTDVGLTCDPCLPPEFLPLELRDLRCRGMTYDLRVDETGAEMVARS